MENFNTVRFFGRDAWLNTQSKWYSIRVRPYILWPSTSQIGCSPMSRISSNISDSWTTPWLTSSRRYVGFHCTCTAHHYRTSVYGQCLHPLCHQLWLETMVTHQNCNGKHIQAEIDDIRARFCWPVHRPYKNGRIFGSPIVSITDMGPVIWAP